jgi:hypothetical protein
MLGKILKLIFILLIAFIGIVGEVADKWSLAVYWIWVIFIMVSLHLGLALKKRVFYALRSDGGPKLKIDESEVKCVFWVVLSSEFCLWLFLAWLCYFALTIH